MCVRLIATLINIITNWGWNSVEKQDLGNILVVDDSRLSRVLIKDELAEQTCRIFEAGDGSEALAIAGETHLDLILLDVHMPGISGLEVLDLLQDDDKLKHIPVIMLTGQGNEAIAVDAMKRGAKDYLVKGSVTRHTLEHAIMNVIEKCTLEYKLAERQQRLEYLARMDALTGIMNRRYFFEHFERELKRTIRHQTPLACVLLDIDFFKRINDDRGHTVGDIAIKSVAQCLEQCARETDFVCRYGGEELCALLPETNEEDALKWAERVRVQLAELEIADGNDTFTLTASFGVAGRLPDISKAEDMIELADQALACAKSSGRNRVVSYSEVADSPTIGALGARAVENPLHGVLVRDIMASPAFCLSETATLQQVAQTIMQLRVNAIAIVDEDGRLSGMVSEKDLIVGLSSINTMCRLVAEVMTQKVVQFSEDDLAQKVIDLFCRSTIRRIVVTKDGQPTGMVSRTSALRWLGNWGECSQAVKTTKPDDNTVTCARTTRSMLVESTDAISAELDQLKSQIQEEQEDATFHLIHVAGKLQELADNLLRRSGNLSQGEQSPIESDCALRL